MQGINSLVPESVLNTLVDVSQYNARWGGDW